MPAGPALPRAAAGFWYNSALRDVDMHPGHKSLFDGLFSQLRVPTRVVEARDDVVAGRDEMAEPKPP